MFNTRTGLEGLRKCLKAHVLKLDRCLVFNFDQPDVACPIAWFSFQKRYEIWSPMRVTLRNAGEMVKKPPPLIW